MYVEQKWDEGYQVRRLASEDDYDLSRAKRIQENNLSFLKRELLTALIQAISVTNHLLFVFFLRGIFGKYLDPGSYFNCIMFMVASSVVLTVLVLNYHHRTPDRYVMPNWVRIVFLQWLPCVLRMNRPGKKITKKTILMSNRMKELELQERSSKSLLANVLDIDDDFRHGNSAANPASGYISRSAYGTPLTARPATVEETSASLPLSGMQKELHTILKELQFITSRMKKADEDGEIISDWKFAAMVVDRLCLFVFTLFTLMATVVILCRAPHIIVQ